MNKEFKDLTKNSQYLLTQMLKNIISKLNMVKLNIKRFILIEQLGIQRKTLCLPMI